MSRDLVTWMKRVAQLAFIGIFTFEFLNAIHALSYKVEYTWFGVTLSTAVIFVGLFLIESLCYQKFDIRLSGVVWLMGLMLIINDFVGDVLGWYSRWQYYDQLIHGLSGFLLVGFFLVLFEAIAQKRAWRVPPTILYGLALGVTTIGAVLYEIEEYAEDLLFGSHRLGDGPDTVNDLIMNLICASLTILIVVAIRAWRHHLAVKRIPVRIWLPGVSLKRSGHL